MTYDEIQVGQRVKITLPTSRYNATGTVKAKEVVAVAGKRRECVYVDTDISKARRLCAPSVLTPCDTAHDN